MLCLYLVKDGDVLNVELVNHVKMRIYYSKTDAGGVVYYGNYSHFIEIGFTEWFREFAKPLTQIYSEDDILMAVQEVHQKYINSLRYDDEICITTKLLKMKQYSVNFEINIYVDERLCFIANISLVPKNYKTRKIAMIPNDVLTHIKESVG